MAREQLVKHCAKSVHIRCTCKLGVVTHGLFWRHVARCAQNFHRARDSAFHFDEACEPEIGEMRFALLVEQNVSGLMSRWRIPCWCAYWTVRASLAISSAPCRIDIGVRLSTSSSLPPSTNCILK